VSVKEDVLRSLGTHLIGIIWHLRGACISIDWVVTRHYDVSESFENKSCCIYR